MSAYVNPWTGVMISGVVIVALFMTLTIRAYVEGWKRRDEERRKWMARRKHT